MDLISQYSHTNVWLTGLSKTQEEACHAALRSFRERHGLASWGLNVNFSYEGPLTWQLDVSVVASAELDFQIRSSHFSGGPILDLGWVVDQCLETHFNACMHSRAISQRPERKPSTSESVLNFRTARAR
jgi:hypothetical protein